MTATADAVIIGGGITGTSAAYNLAARGVNVILCEKRFLAAGSTGRSSAIIRQHYSNAVTARMALFSLGVFQNFAEEIGGDAGFVQTGFAMMVQAKDRVALDENVHMQQSVGVNTRVIGAQELVALEPTLSVPETMFAAYEPEGGYADPAATVNSYADAAKRAGARIRQETRVTNVLMEHSHVVGVETVGGKISSPNVVNCANAWAPQIAAMVNLELPIRAERHQVASFERPAALSGAHLTAADLSQDIYFRPEGKRLTLVGSIDSHHGTLINPDQFNEEADFDFVSDCAQRLSARYPAMEQALSRRGWSGVYGVTPDWHPIMDEAPRDSGFFIAAGFSGHGFKLGPAVGVMIADMVTRASAPTAQLDRELFRYGRFADHTPIAGKYEYGIAG